MAEILWKKRRHMGDEESQAIHLPEARWPPPAPRNSPQPGTRPGLSPQGHVTEPGGLLSARGPWEQDCGRGVQAPPGTHRGGPGCPGPRATKGPRVGKRRQGAHTVSLVHHGVDHQGVDLSVQVEAKLEGKKRNKNRGAHMLNGTGTIRKGGIVSPRTCLGFSTTDLGATRVRLTEGYQFLFTLFIYVL